MEFNMQDVSDSSGSTPVERRGRMQEWAGRGVVMMPPSDSLSPSHSHSVY